MPYTLKEVATKAALRVSLSKSPKKFATSRVHAFALFGIGACFVIWASLFIYQSSFVGIDGRRYFCLFDDAMVSMRYAWNLSHGLGLVWNPGEYVEGYTNPLMTLLMSLPTLVFDKVNAVLAVQISLPWALSSSRLPLRAVVLSLDLLVVDGDGDRSGGRLPVA
jgi:hypothetical protein